MDWKVGFVGFSSKQFDVNAAKTIISNIMKVFFSVVFY
jgi:hypothetical protein